MFERVIAQTIQKITAETLQDRSLIPLLDILQDARIPARIKPFFETEVHWWLYNDALARAANKRFDYEHPELTSLLNYIEQVQFRHARFEREEFVAVLDSAVKLIYNYLCRPQTTLKWYIFRGQPVRPLNEVMLRFSAFIDYEYFRTVFTDWVERKRAERPTFDAISATEFERVIRRIDDQILLNCTVEGLLEMMDPLFDFIGEGNDQLIPIDALVIFFDDKNIKKLVDQLENYRERGGESVGREGFVALLDELLSSTDDEPEVDFSNVYQNDALDEVMREHLQSGGRGPAGTGHADSYDPPMNEPAAEEPAPVEQFQPAPEPEGEPEPERAHEPEPAPASEEPVDIPLVATPMLPAIDPAVSEEPDELPGAIIPSDPVAPSFEDAVPYDEPEEEPVAEAPSPELPGADALRAALDGVSQPASAEDELFDDDDDLEIELEEHEAPAVVDEPAPFGAAEADVTLEWEEDEEDDDDDVDGISIAGEREEAEAGEEEDEGEEEDDEDEGDDESEPEDEDHDDDDDGIDAALNGAPAHDGEPARASESAASPHGRDGEAAIAELLPIVMEDVRRFIDPSLERKVAKKIFGKNRAEYEAALDRINGATSWRAASQVLDEIFIRFDVDPYSRTAIRFTDSVYGRYLPGNR